MSRPSAPVSANARNFMSETPILRLEYDFRWAVGRGTDLPDANEAFALPPHLDERYSCTTTTTARFVRSRTWSAVRVICGSSPFA